MVKPEVVLKNEKEAATVSWSVAFKPKKYAHVTSSTVWDGKSVANYAKCEKMRNLLKQISATNFFVKSNALRHFLWVVICLHGKSVKLVGNTEWERKP